MTEVTAIINARSLVLVPGDPRLPQILTSLLTQRTECLKAPSGSFTNSDLSRKQWREVQYLADQFRSRWRREYLPTLQSKRKWQEETRNYQEWGSCRNLLKNSHQLLRIRNHYTRMRNHQQFWEIKKLYSILCCKLNHRFELKR